MLTTLSCIPSLKFLCQLLQLLFSIALYSITCLVQSEWIATDNPDKSEVMYIGTRQRLRISELPETVTVAGSTTATTDKLKVLGVVLDSSLTFDQHVRNTVRNCNFHLRALRHIRPSLTSDVANTSVLNHWFPVGLL